MITINLRKLRYVTSVIRNLTLMKTMKVITGVESILFVHIVLNFTVFIDEEY